MDWNLVLKIAGPFLIQMMQSSINDLGTNKPPPDIVRHPSETIKHLQSFLNVALNVNPPLTVDGWLGPKTEAAIEDGINKLKTAGIG